MLVTDDHRFFSAVAQSPIVWEGVGLRIAACMLCSRMFLSRRVNKVHASKQYSTLT